MTHLVIGTAGHIDHGKSALVRALTGIDPDRLKEEKARGITIDLGFAHRRFGDVNVAFVDVPGHERFVKNMLAGAGGIDAVLLVVAADEGVMPQTREHLDICLLLGVTRGLVALTKADLVDPDMLELAQLDVRELLAGTALADVAMLPVSARSGEGLDALRSAIVELSERLPARDDGAPARLAIDRVFSMRGFGTVVTGTLSSGRLAADESLEVLPGRRLVRTRGVQVHGGRRVVAAAGERVAVNLAGIDVSEIARGAVLATPGSLPTTKVIDAVVSVLPASRPIRHGTRVRFHQGTAEILARVATVGPAVDGDPPPLLPGTTGLARLRLESPAALTRGDRYVLRSYSPSITIAGGRVLDPAPPPGGVRAAATLARLARLQRALDDDEEDALLALVSEAGARGLEIDAIRARAGASSRGRAALETLVRRPDIWPVGDRLLAAAWRPELERRVIAALTAHHDREPHSEGLAREQVREHVLGAAHPAVATAVLDDLEASGRVRGRDRLALPGRGVTLTVAEQEALAAIEGAFLDAGLTPPDLETLPAKSGVAADAIARLLPLLVRQQTLVRVSTLTFHRDALTALRADMASLKQAGEARVDVGTFKQRYGLTRKHAIPLLEYLDRERITRRAGESRVLL